MGNANSYCPVCNTQIDKDVSAECKPFCSNRCKDIDLHRWLSDYYIVNKTEQDDDNRPAKSPIAGDISDED